MTDIENRLLEIDRKLDRLAIAVEAIAVQDVKIIGLTKRVDDLCVKWDHYLGPKGIVDDVRTHQASCPRDQIKWLWTVVVPMALTLLGMGVALLRLT